MSDEQLNDLHFVPVHFQQTRTVPAEVNYGPTHVGRPATRDIPHCRTVDEVTRLLDRVTLRYPPFKIHWRIDGRGGQYDLVTLEVVAHVRDRTSGLARRQGFYFTERLPLSHASLLYWFENVLRAVWMHEFEECYHVDGIRVHDPHKGGVDHVHGYDRGGYRR